jgi:hypothetical protein
MHQNNIVGNAPAEKWLGWLANYVNLVQLPGVGYVEHTWKQLGM